MDKRPTWYRLALIARRNGFREAWDYIANLILSNVALETEDLKAIYKAYSDIDLVDEAEYYLKAGKWTDE